MRRYALRTTRPVTGKLDLPAALNEPQRAVVTAGGGALLVIAGAGSGKTRTLTYRAAYLIASGLDPDSLLLCTFTNRAAREMVHRVETLLEAEIRPKWAGTFHHIANVALRRHAHFLDLSEDYTILDTEDARDLMAACLAEEGQKLRQQRFPRANVLHHICSTSVNCRLPISDAVRREAPRFIDLTDDIERISSRYATRKRQLALVDYDDLLLHFHALLADHPDPSEKIKERFRHVLVDEYQDTNLLQAEIVDMCASLHGNLTVVGDDAQSIYSFRGAHLENMVQFTRRYPQATTHKLELNYRSTPEILKLANASIRHNVKQLPKTLRPTRSPGMSPVLAPLEDVYQQAVFVGQRVLELHQEEDIPLADIAVLYRAHAHSMELQLELVRRKIPFTVRSGVRFFEQAHIKDVVAYLRLLHNAGDPLAWQRVLRTWSGVGKRSSAVLLDQLLSGPRPTAAGQLLDPEQVASRLPASARPGIARLRQLLSSLRPADGVGQLIQTVLHDHYADYAHAAFPNAADRIADLEQLADYARRYESLELFLSELSLVSGFAAEGVSLVVPSDDALTLSTIHQAKGLEWRVVFVIGLAEGRFPQPIVAKTPRELEEERRLFYVSSTRAKDQLYLCHPRFEEPQSGPRRLLRISRFLDELYDGYSFPYERWEIEPC